MIEGINMHQNTQTNKTKEMKELRLGMFVYHKDIYHGHERMKIVGIREKHVELEGDYSGGTHNVCQRDWERIDGLILT